MYNFIKKNKLATFFIALVAVLIIATIYIQLNSVRSEKDLLEKYGLNGLTTEEIVSKLDSITNEGQGFKASISANKLTISEDGVIIEYPVPENKFYLSFAPYMNQTHPCGTHSLATCRSELRHQKFFVTITTNTGEVIISEEMETMANGFIGVWLPKNMEGLITVKQGEFTAQTEFSTKVQDNTCMTTPLRLK